MYSIRLIEDNNILKFIATNDVINWMFNFIPNWSRMILQKLEQSL